MTGLGAAAAAAALVCGLVECVLARVTIADSPVRLRLVLAVFGAGAGTGIALAVLDALLVAHAWFWDREAWDVRARDARAALGVALRSPGSLADRAVAGAIASVSLDAVVTALATAAAALVVFAASGSGWGAAVSLAGAAVGIRLAYRAVAAALGGARRADAPNRRFPRTLFAVFLAVATGGAAVALALAVVPDTLDDLRLQTVVALVASIAAYVAVRIRLDESVLRVRRLAPIALVAPVALGVGLWRGADPDVRADVSRGGLVSSLLAAAVGYATDLDGDGFGIGLGGGDCAPKEAAVHPEARDVPENGIDENCSGRDARRFVEARPRPFALPAGFPRDLSVVLLVVDSVRADVLGVEGYRRRVTPKMDAFTKRAAYFADAWSNSPGTHQSFSSMLTSLYPRAVPLDAWARTMGSPLRDEARTLAEAAQGAGLETSAIFSFRYFEAGRGFDQGFDHYDAEAAKLGTIDGITAPTILRKVREEIARLGTRRFFFFVHVLDPHHQYMVHDGYPFFGWNRRNRYDAEIAYTDDHVGRMIDAIRRGPQGAKTAIVLTSDHGDAFLEHGVVYHNTTVYTEMLRVPLAIELPPSVRGFRPRRLEAPVSLVDVFPTVTALVGATNPPRIEGHSLVGPILGGPEDSGRIVYSETTDVQQPRRRLRRVLGETRALIHDATAQQFQLFDRRRDPGEHRPIPSDDEGERLLSAIEAIEARVGREERRIVATRRRSR